ncbi:MAG: carboxylesterase family protein, partial [Myxococcota bacterium]
RENIDRFGGDPSNVTVCGQSAGAMSVAALLGASVDTRPFRRAILQSGAARHVIGRQRADRIGEAFLAALGQPARTVEALAEISTTRILQAQGRINRELMNLSDLMVMLPCVDGQLVSEQPLRRVEAGEVRDVDLLIGTTIDEWKLFSPLEVRFPSFGEETLVERFAELLPNAFDRAPPPRTAALQFSEAVRERGGRTTPFEVWNCFQSARVFHQPAAELASAHSRSGGRVHSYLFAWRPPALGRSLGACHAMDVPFVFGLPSRPITRFLPGLVGPARRLSTRMQHAWANFARCGDPGHERLPNWDPYNDEHRSSMLLDRECGLADRPLETELRLIEGWGG